MGDRTSARENEGYETPSHPETNRRIRAHFNLERSLQVTEGIPFEVVERAHGVLSAEALRYDVGHRGRKQVMRDLRGIGYPLKPYSGLSPQDLREYLSRLQSEVKNRINLVHDSH